MSLRRFAAVQAHPLPRTVSSPVGYQDDANSHTGKRSPGLFDAAINRGPTPMDPRSVTTYEVEEFPPGATCLNGMMGVPLYTCDSCGSTVAEAEFDAHVCGYGETDHSGY